MIKGKGISTSELGAQFSGACLNHKPSDSDLLQRLYHAVRTPDGIGTVLEASPMTCTLKVRTGTESLAPKYYKASQCEYLSGGKRPPNPQAQLLDCCRADFRGRLGFAEREYPEPDYVAEAFAAAQAVPVQPIIAAGYQGEAIRQKLGRERQLAIRAVRERWLER